VFRRAQNLPPRIVHQKLNLCHCSVQKGMIVLQPSFQVSSMMNIVHYGSSNCRFAKFVKKLFIIIN